VLGVDEVGLRQQRLLGEGPERPEEPHSFRHGRKARARRAVAPENPNGATTVHP
jgi:hypothetical protein